MPGKRRSSSKSARRGGDAARTRSPGSARPQDERSRRGDTPGSRDGDRERAPAVARGPEETETQTDEANRFGPGAEGRPL